MKITIGAGLLAKGDVDVDSRHGFEGRLTPEQKGLIVVITEVIPYLKFSMKFGWLWGMVNTFAALE